MKTERIESKQIEGTISENIRYFEIDLEREINTVKAIFWSKKHAKEYAEKFFVFNNGVNCKHQELGFASFVYYYDADYIEATSNYHQVETLINMFEDGKF